MTDSLENALERIEFLAASPTRPLLLDAVATDPASPQELTDRLDIPRSTLRRNLSALVEKQYVSHSLPDNEYALTATGELVKDAFDDIVSTVNQADSLAPFLDRFPTEIPVSPTTLAACESRLSESDDPFAPISSVKDWVLDSESARGFLPVINPLYMAGLETCLTEEIRIELIAPRAAFVARFDDAVDTFREIGAAPHIDLYESSSIPDYAVGFVDETVLLGAFDDHLRTHSVLRADSDSEITHWADDQYESVKRTATALDLESLA